MMDHHLCQSLRWSTRLTPWSILTRVEPPSSIAPWPFELSIHHNIVQSPHPLPFPPEPEKTLDLDKDTPLPLAKPGLTPANWSYPSPCHIERLTLSIYEFVRLTYLAHVP